MSDQKNEDHAELIKKLSLESKTKSMSDYKFWSTQPVPQFDDQSLPDGPIEMNKKKEEIRKEPLPLPDQFEWTVLDLNNEDQCQSVYQLLTENYVEDEDAMFRFDYSADFLKWGLLPPGFKKHWLIGVRASGNKKLVAFISGIPVNLRMKDRMQQMVEINFLCIHKKLRSKRLAPVLIKEITRLVHLEGIFQAVYTAGATLPKPVATCRYYHRSLNPKKLIEVNFSALAPNMTIARTIKLYKVPEQTSAAGLRPMKESDVNQVQKLLSKYLQNFPFAPTFNKEEVKHWFLPRQNVVYSYVAEEAGNKITDFISFYSLPSSVIRHPTHSHINAAYLFYYAPKSSESLTSLIMDALILAKQLGFDVFNCLNLMNNHVFLDELKFGKGDGFLNYYLYNYALSGMSDKDIGLVML